MPDLPPAEAIPGMTPFMPPPPPIPAVSSTAAVQPEPANVVSAAVAAGAAADQEAGTDIPPTEDAEPMPANVAPPTPPDAPASDVPKPKPAPNGEPARKWPRSGNVAVIIAEFQASVTPML